MATERGGRPLRLQSEAGEGRAHRGGTRGVSEAGSGAVGGVRRGGGRGGGRPVMRIRRGGSRGRSRGDEGGFGRPARPVGGEGRRTSADGVGRRDRADPDPDRRGREEKGIGGNGVVG